MKFALNVRTLHDTKIRGLSRYTLNLLHALTKENFNLSIFLVSDVPLPHDTHTNIQQMFPHKKVEILENRFFPSILWLNAFLPFLLFFKGINIYHAPNNKGIPILYALKLRRIKTIVTIHDIIAIKAARQSFFSLSKLLFLLEWWSSKQADVILTVSNFSKNELINVEHVDAKKIFVIPNCAQETFYNTALLPSQRSYFLYIGGYEDRKNVETLLRGFKLYCSKTTGVFPLKLIGKMGPHEKTILDKVIEIPSKSPPIEVTGYLDDQKLPSLYRNALAVIVPSKYEGFGLQVIEAMAAGTPVISSNATSLPEVGGDAPLYFSPDSPEELATLLLDISRDEGLQKRCEKRSLKQSQYFHPSKTTQSYLSFLAKQIG